MPKTSVKRRKKGFKEIDNNSESSESSYDSEKYSKWGRRTEVDPNAIFLSLMVLVFSPILVFYFWASCDHYNCSLFEPLEELLSDSFSISNFNTFFLNLIPEWSLYAFKIYSGWIMFQVVLYIILPGKIVTGQLTPAGFILPYKVNGLFAWCISLVLFLILSFRYSLFSPSIIYDNWGGLLIATNIYGFGFALLAYIKAHSFPSYPKDNKFSNSAIYDLYMGIELNPRLSVFDFKLFFNGRPGIIGWTLTNFSFLCAQYNKIGYVTNSMLLVNILQAVYVVDFFIHEDWYLKTIDIAHDHFGFYLAWGDQVWLPFLYTLQVQYLVVNPVILSRTKFLAILIFGILGYCVFRLANNQKFYTRKTNGKCLIWNQPAEVIKTKYYTSDGIQHEGLLLISGFWGLSRHFNYLGDLTLSLSFCLACGCKKLLPYFYIIYMTVLLTHRVFRDDKRCREKYGKYWENYCYEVPYKLIPFIF